MWFRNMNFFPNQGPKEGVSPARPKEGAEKVTGQCVFVPVSTPARSQGKPSALVWNWGFSLVSGRCWLERKKPSGHLRRAGPLVTTGWFCYKRNWGEAEIEEAAASPLSPMPLLSQGEVLNIGRRAIAERKNGKAINQETL